MIAISTIILALTIVIPPGKASARHPLLPAAHTADTIDVPVGSPLIDGRRMTAFTTHLQVHRMIEGTSTLVQEARNTITFGDSAGRAVTRVVSNGEVRGPNGTRAAVSNFTFDRRTLELLSASLPGPNGSMIVRNDGQGLHLSMRGAAAPMDVPLSQRSFYGPWSDYVVEELPMREGAVYRVALWRPAGSPTAMTASVEKHLYVVRGREDVEVFGKTHKAWIVDDRTEDGSKLLGTMYIVDGPPKLVRWTINTPDGSTVQIDQEVVTK